MSTLARFMQLSNLACFLSAASWRSRGIFSCCIVLIPFSTCWYNWLKNFEVIFCTNLKLTLLDKRHTAFYCETVFSSLGCLRGCYRISISISSVAQSGLTLWDHMDCSLPGFPVHHQLPELAQTHVLWVSDAIQPSHSLLSLSPAFNLSQHHGLF